MSKYWQSFFLKYLLIGYVAHIFWSNLKSDWIYTGPEEKRRSNGVEKRCVMRNKGRIGVAYCGRLGAKPVWMKRRSVVNYDQGKRRRERSTDREEAKVLCELLFACRPPITSTLAHRISSCPICTGLHSPSTPTPTSVCVLPFPNLAPPKAE